MKTEQDSMKTERRNKYVFSFEIAYMVMIQQVPAAMVT
jgi:hypothetical protein